MALGVRVGAIARWLEAQWRREDPHLLLRALSPVWQVASAAHLAWRARRAARAPLPVISVGNITAGGSGKTPFCAWLAEALAAQGEKPAILSRGRCRHPRRVHPDDDPAIVGDEPLMLAMRGLFVIAGRNRIAAAHLAARLGATVAILDDGFQYRKLVRDLDIVLIPNAGVGNGRVLPAGPLREPLSALARADAIVRTGMGEPEAPVPLPAGKPVFRLRWRVEGLVQMAGPPTPPPRRAFAVAAIARPHRFLDALAEAGVAVGGHMFFADHHRYSRAEAQTLAQKAPVVCTEKDAAKLIRLWPKDAPLFVLKIAPQPSPKLLAFIQTKLAEIRKRR
ncbi:MAG: tetraacyldisaccharide 4'-kinase [Zetaproteobacteria bacterium]|nr:MAG: tetraacyldisaccharide 4'-kinase [Zetaproteobacteria bacterium]